VKWRTKPRRIPRLKQSAQSPPVRLLLKTFLNTQSKRKVWSPQFGKCRDESTFAPLIRVRARARTSCVSTPPSITMKHRPNPARPLHRSSQSFSSLLDTAGVGPPFGFLSNNAIQHLSAHERLQTIDKLISKRLHGLPTRPGDMRRND